MKSYDFDHVAALAANFSGTIGVCAERLDTGERLGYNADESFPGASLIKLPVLVEFFRQLASGRFSLDERVELSESDKVIGSGILKELRPGLHITMEDLLILMMVISDNTATNMVIDQVGMDHVNRTVGELGLSGTCLSGKILIDQTHHSDTPTGKGELSPMTPADLVRLLMLVERRECLGAEYCEQLLGILKRVQTDSVIAQGLPYELLQPAEGQPLLVVAHKTGSIRGVRHNAGLVYTPEFTYAIALMSKGSKDMRTTHDHEGRVVLREISKLVYEHFTHA